MLNMRNSCLFLLLSIQIVILISFHRYFLCPYEMIFYVALKIHDSLVIERPNILIPMMRHLDKINKGVVMI